MKLALAFLAVVAIWSTTPLAIKWSTETVSFVTAVGLRMALGAGVCLILLHLRRQRMRWDRDALASYASAVIGVFGAMSLVYLSVQYIASGLVSVVFGVAPLLSGVFAHRLLGEVPFTPLKLLALALSFGGLSWVFQGELGLAPGAWPGLLSALLATVLFSLSGVLVKRTAARMDPLVHTTGSLLLSLPLFVLSWVLLDGAPPQGMGLRSALAIGYLGIVGSVIGFLLYFYILQRLPASKVALVPLITPVFALMLGAALAGERVSQGTWFGTLLILAGLAAYQLSERRLPLWTALRRRGPQREARIAAVE